MVIGDRDIGPDSTERDWLIEGRKKGRRGRREETNGAFFLQLTRLGCDGYPQQFGRRFLLKTRPYTRPHDAHCLIRFERRRNDWVHRPHTTCTLHRSRTNQYVVLWGFGAAHDAPFPLSFARSFAHHHLRGRGRDILGIRISSRLGRACEKERESGGAGSRFGAASRVDSPPSACSVRAPLVSPIVVVALPHTFAAGVDRQGPRAKGEPAVFQPCIGAQASQPQPRLGV